VLIKIKTPKGKSLKYEYDNIVSDRPISCISNLGISKQLEYDNYGNIITNKIIKNNPMENIIDGVYKIRLKGTKKYLRNINNLICIKQDNCNHDLWNIEKNGEYYKIYHSILKNKYLTVKNNIIILSDDDGDYSLFELIKNDNNSYYVKTKLNNNYIKVNNDSLQIYECTEYNPGDLEEEGNNQLSNTTNDPINLLPDFDFNFEFYFETVDSDYFIENNIEYSNDGRFITKITDALLNNTKYNINSDTGLLISKTNSKNQTTYYEYNNKNKISSITDVDKKINYIYNNQNLISKVIVGNKEYNIEYDEFLNVKKIKLGNNITLVTYYYDINNGNLISKQYGNDDLIIYEYDDFDRIIKIANSDNSYNYKYNSNGDLVKIISRTDEINYKYDFAKRLNEYIKNDFKINYKYDSNNNIINTKYNYSNGYINYNISNILNENDDIIKTIFDDNEIVYNYDCFGRIINSSMDGEINIEYKYVNKGKRTSLLIESISNNGDIYSYKYDKLYNITHIYHNNNLENRYYYDKYNQLKLEENYLTNQIIKYTYDNNLNILCKEIRDISNNNLISKDNFEYNNDNWCDQLSKFNHESIDYDNLGNPIKINDNIALEWSNGRELKTYNDSQYNIYYEYDSNGIRTGKIVNNNQIKYYLRDNRVILEINGPDVIYYIYNDESGLIGFKYNNSLYYYVKNLQKDIIGIIDCKYNLVANYTYDSWGNIISITDGNGNDISNNENHIGNINPFRYRSYYYDKETKLYYLNSRYYNPKWGRFLNSDTIIGTADDLRGHNLYLYCDNNPINLSDLDGSAANYCIFGAAGFSCMKFEYPLKSNKKQSFTTSYSKIPKQEPSKSCKVTKETAQKKTPPKTVTPKTNQPTCTKSWVVETGKGSGIGAEFELFKTSIGIQFSKEDVTLYSSTQGKVCYEESVQSFSYYAGITRRARKYKDCVTKEYLDIPEEVVVSSNFLIFERSSDGSNTMFFGTEDSVYIGPGARVKAGYEISCK